MIIDKMHYNNNAYLLRQRVIVNVNHAIEFLTTSTFIAAVYAH